MIYENTFRGKFIERPNRFMAYVEINGKKETVHVKNTGRCRELLLPGADVTVQYIPKNSRKTAYDLISVFKPTLGWVNIDSQAANKVAFEFLSTQGYSVIRPEYVIGSSRIDFLLEKNTEKTLLEIKGCTLEINGYGYFPDAPSERAAKHCRELSEKIKEGYHCAIGFVIAMENVKTVLPNVSKDPKFASALGEAEKNGVEIWFLPCAVTENSIVINEIIKKI